MLLALQLTTALSYAPRPLPLAARCQSLSMSASRNNNIEVNWQKLVNSGDAASPTACRCKVQMRLFDERNEKDDGLAWWELRADPDGPLPSSERFAMYSLPLGFFLVSIVAYNLSWLFPVKDGGIASVSIPFFIALWLIDTSFDRR